MSHYCLTCKGSGERDMRGNLDCHEPGCNAAVERAELESHLLALGRLHERDLVWEAYKLGQAKAASAWINVSDRLPAVGEWCNVLVDRELGDYWDRQNKPRFDVYGVQLREIDSEGYATWQRWKMADGGPMGLVYMVSHWMPLPAAPANNNTEKADE